MASRTSSSFAREVRFLHFEARPIISAEDASSDPKPESPEELLLSVESPEELSSFDAPDVLALAERVATDCDLAVGSLGWPPCTAALTSSLNAT